MQRNKLNSLSRLESRSNSGWKGPLEAIYITCYGLVSVWLANMKLGTHLKKMPHMLISYVCSFGMLKHIFFSLAACCYQQDYSQDNY